MGGISSCAVARDSSNGWFESKRHFCGALSGFWPDLELSTAIAAEEIRAGKVQPSTNTPPIVRAAPGHIPKQEEIVAVAFAPNLQKAREELANLGFTPLKK